MSVKSESNSLGSESAPVVLREVELMFTKQMIIDVLSRPGF